MANSDYLIKATLKKISEKFNKTFFEKIEEVASAAQEVPDIILKELEILKEEIKDEARKLEELDEKTVKFDKDAKDISPKEHEALNKIESIKSRLNNLNIFLDK